MRSVCGLAGVLLLGACERTGVEIIVYPPADPSVEVDEIRLYLGVGYGTSATILTPGPTAARMVGPEGTYWTRDANNELDVVTMTPGAATPAHFVYLGGDGQVLTAIAVGYLGGVPNSTIAAFDLTLPPDKFAVHRMGLNPALEATTNGFAVNQVQLWGPETFRGVPDQACVRAENYRGDVDDSYERVAYIVSSDDPDCDGFLNHTPEECQETVYRGKKVPAKDTLDCLTSDMVTTSAGAGSVKACVVAADRCEDGKPETRVDCSMSLPFCAPQSLCDECDTDFGCAIEPLKHNLDSQTHMSCAIHFTDLGNGKIQLCPQELVSVPPQLNLTEQCEGLPVFRGSGSGPADGKGLDRWASKWVQGSASLTFQPAEPTCGFAFKVQGTVSSAAFPVAGLVAVSMPSVRGDRGVIVPIKIDLVDGGCDGAVASVCTPINAIVGDTINDCLQNIVPGE